MSLVPAVTEMLFAIGAGDAVVAVSSYDTYPPAVTALPRVGALLDPDVERILTLRPDLVIVYGSQTTEEQRLQSAGIRTFAYRHASLEGVFTTIVDLGGVTGRPEDAAHVVAAMRERIDRVRQQTAGRPRPRALVVFDRPPGTLTGMYVSGGRGFLHDMLTLAGADNVFADVPREGFQPSREQLLTRAPEIVIEVSSDQAASAGRDRASADDWQHLSSIPAVRHGRITRIASGSVVIPGPRVVDGIERMARAIHPDAFPPEDDRR